MANEAPQTVFTMLAQIKNKKMEHIDAKWYTLFHEGDWYRSSFLFIDTVSVMMNNHKVHCNHYRFDIEKSEEVDINFSSSDYFSDHIAATDAVRQIWVESNGKNRQIIKAQVTIYGITLTAVIQNYTITKD